MLSDKFPAGLGVRVPPTEAGHTLRIAPPRIPGIPSEIRGKIDASRDGRADGLFFHGEAADDEKIGLLAGHLFQTAPAESFAQRFGQDVLAEVAKLGRTRAERVGAVILERSRLVVTRVDGNAPAARRKEQGQTTNNDS